MRLPVEWLQAYARAELSTEQLADRQVGRAVFVQPLDGNPHQPNCSRKRASLS